MIMDDMPKIGKWLSVSGRLLKTCAEQLGPIFHFIFSLSISQQKVPSLWKQSTIVPVAKSNKPVTLNDFRPVVKSELVAKTERLLDPLQSAYRAGRGVQDALYLTSCTSILKVVKPMPGYFLLLSCQLLTQ